MGRSMAQNGDLTKIYVSQQTTSLNSSYFLRNNFKTFLGLEGSSRQMNNGHPFYSSSYGLINACKYFVPFSNYSKVVPR